jgi:hypothetical protein
MRRLLCCLLVLLVAGPAAAARAPLDRVYRLEFRAALEPATHRALARIRVVQPWQRVRRIEFIMPADRYLDVAGDGEITRNGDRIEWVPPRKGGDLHYAFAIDHQRDNGRYDARITADWALLKLDHLFPRAAARFSKGAHSVATLRLVAPAGWAIETPYGSALNRLVDFDDPGRSFDLPGGWLIAGKLAIRRDNFGERLISVASPRGIGFHANDILAFVRWNMPVLVELLPEFPQRLLIVGAPEGMWRGGLSGVDSLYVHVDRPLISGNRTSTLLHELIHVASSLHGVGGADWIVEGLAEFYSLEVLWRSGAISERRFEESFTQLAQWSATQQCEPTDRSKSTETARAVLVMRALDQEIREATGGKRSLDQVMQTLVTAHKPVTNAAFRAAAVALIGGPATALANCP